MPSIINAATSGGLISTADTSGVLQLQTASTTALTITAAQNVGIGTASPAVKTEISGTAAASNLALRITNTATDGYSTLQMGGGGDAGIYRNGSAQSGYAGASSLNLITVGAHPIGFSTQNTLRAVIDSSGNVGIGTSTPQMKLDINGGVRVQSIANPSSGAGMELAYDGTQGIMQAYSNRATLTPVPVYLVTGQLKFPPTQVPSADANTLDDYEEGTWTPTIGMNVGTSTGSSGEGTYIKIGRQVTVTVYLAVGTISAGGSINTINGLPFTVRSGNDQSIGLSRENALTGFGWELRASSGGNNLLIRRVSDNADAIQTGMNFVGTVTYFV